MKQRPNKRAMPEILLCLVTLALLTAGPGQASEDKFIFMPDSAPAGWSSERYLTLAHTYKNVGEPEKARAALELAIKVAKSAAVKKRAERMLASELPRYPVSKAANRMNNLAFEEMAHQRLGKAITAFEHCAAQYPKFETPLNSLSTIYILKKKPDLAREFAQKALAINPNSSNAWLNLGNSYLLQSDYRKAKKCGEKALQCYPENISAVEMLTYIKVKENHGERL